MRWMLTLCLLLFLVGCATSPRSPEERIESLGKQLRCPVCRGVPIIDSPSALAQEMMQIVRQQVAEGKSDEEILKYFEDRYGEWARLQPKAEGLNLTIWILPGAFVGAGVVFILWWLKKQGIKDLSQK